jgi:hypothetical protein
MITTDQYGEKTGAWLRDAQTGRLAEVGALSQQPVPPAHGHAKARTTRRPWWMRRKQAPASVAPAERPLTASRLLAMADISEPGEFTQAVNRWQSPVTGEGALERPAPAAEVAHEPADPEPTAAIDPADMPHDLITDPAPTPRPFTPEPAGVYVPGYFTGIGAETTWHPAHAQGEAPPPAVAWGEWDDKPGESEPMQRYIPDLNADLADLPQFRATLAASAAIARRSLFGCATDEGTRGGRMVSAGIWLYSVPEDTAAAFAAKAEPAVREDTIMLKRVAA